MMALLRHELYWKSCEGEKTLAEIAAEFGIHPNQIFTWKKHVMEALPELLSSKVKTSAKEQEELQNELYQQIGELKVQNEFLKKLVEAPFTLQEKRNMIQGQHPSLSVQCQCRLLGLSVSTYYYRPVNPAPSTYQLM